MKNVYFEDKRDADVWNVALISLCVSEKERERDALRVLWLNSAGGW